MLTNGVASLTIFFSLLPQWFQNIIEETVPAYYTEKSIQVKVRSRSTSALTIAVCISVSQRLTSIVQFQRYITWCLVCRILQEGDGFLRWNKSFWERVPLDDQRQKVAHALQYKIRALVKEEQRKEEELEIAERTIKELRRHNAGLGISTSSHASDSSESCRTVDQPAVGRAFEHDSIQKDRKPAPKYIRDPTYNPWPRSANKPWPPPAKKMKQQQWTSTTHSQQDLEEVGTVVLVTRKRQHNVADENKVEKARRKDPPIHFYAVSSSHDLWSDEGMGQQPTNILSGCRDSY